LREEYHACRTKAGTYEVKLLERLSFDERMKAQLQLARS
jgi:hypothetical protein